MTLENSTATADVSIREGLEAILAQYATARASQPFAGHPIRSTFEQVTVALAATDAVEKRPTLKLKASIVLGKWTTVPWIALLDTRETDTFQNGVYCVYLFREDMSGVYLTLAQGVTELKEQYGGDAKAREQLRYRASNLRQWCEGLDQHDFALDGGIDLHTKGALGKNYEASAVAHKFYTAGSVPEDLALVNDLEVGLTAYNRYLEGKHTTSRLWAIYVGHGAADNFELGRSRGTWGASAKGKFEGIKKDDSLLFLHALTSDASPVPKGFPRVRLSEQEMPSGWLGVRPLPRCSRTAPHCGRMGRIHTVSASRRRMKTTTWNLTTEPFRQRW